MKINDLNPSAAVWPNTKANERRVVAYGRIKAPKSTPSDMKKAMEIIYEVRMCRMGSSQVPVRKTR